MPYRNLRHRRVFTLLTAAIVATACGASRTITVPDDSGVERSYVTGAAAAALDANGQFHLQSGGDWRRPELTEAEAAAMADVYALRYAPTLPEWFERHRGARIDFANLRRCGRVFYALSPYIEPADGYIEPSELSAGIVNALASRWMFTYCDAGNSPALSVAVAATATHLRITPGGTFDPFTRRGNEFHASGIPLGTTAPILPERAVERVALESGARVASVPRLLLPGFKYFPQSARWVLNLGRDVETRSPQGVHGTGLEFFVGQSLTDWSVGVYRALDTVRGDTLFLPSGKPLVFTRRSDAPGAWESVQFARARP